MAGPSHRADPIDRRHADPVKFNNNLEVLEWFGGIENASVSSEKEWISLDREIAEGRLLIAGEEGDQLESVSVNNVMDLRMGRDLALADKLRQASLEGRLFIKNKDSGTLLQVQTEKVQNEGDAEPSFEVRISQAMEKPPWVKGFEMEAIPEEEFIKMPAKPSFLRFKRAINAIFGGFKEELNRYDEQMAKYADQQNTVAIRREEQREVNRYHKAAAPKSLDNPGKAKVLKSLQQQLNSIGYLDPNAAKLQETKHVVQKLDACYKNGLKVRLETINKLQEGTFFQQSFGKFEEALGDVMLGEMVRRGMTDPNPKNREQFYRHFRDNPQAMEQWKVQLLNTPAARAVLAQKDEGLGRVLVSDVALNQLVNKAIPDAQKAMTGQGRAVGLQNQHEMVNTNTVEMMEQKPKSIESPGRSGPRIPGG